MGRGVEERIRSICPGGARRGCASLQDLVRFFLWGEQNLADANVRLRTHSEPLELVRNLADPRLLLTYALDLHPLQAQQRVELHVELGLDVPLPRA